MGQSPTTGRTRGADRLPAAVICPPGLEALCQAELRSLGCRPKPAGPGTVEMRATARQLYAANVWLRTASRVVVRVATFRSTDFAHLQRRVGDIDWSPWLADGVAPVFRVSANDSKLYHTQAIAQRLHEVVGPGPAQPGQPEQLFVVRVERNTVTISADSSGEALHRRPWRTDLGVAPLRTTMAAGMLLATGWDGSTSLVDPFCGSGTIVIEAALLARGLPPGRDRTFAFQHWPSFQPGTLASVRGQVASAARPLPAPVVLAGSDRDRTAVAAARANAERAGVADDIELETRVIAHLPADRGVGLVATNPPYGKRLGDRNLDGLYRRLGSVARDRRPGWGLALVCPDRRLGSVADGRLRSIARFRHGGLSVDLLHRPGQPVTSPTAEEGDDVIELDGPEIEREPDSAAADQTGTAITNGHR